MQIMLFTKLVVGIRVKKTKQLTVLVKRKKFFYYPTLRADEFVTFEVKLSSFLSSKRELVDDILKLNSDVSKELMQNLHFYL